MKTFTEVHLERWDGVEMVVVEDHYIDTPIRGRFSDVLVRIPVPAWEDTQAVWNTVLDLWTNSGWRFYRWQDEKDQLDARDSDLLAKRPKGRMYQLLRSIEQSKKLFTQNEIIELLSKLK